MLVVLHPVSQLCEGFEFGVEEEVPCGARTQRAVFHVGVEQVDPGVDGGHSEGDGEEGGQVGGVEGDQNEGHEPPNCRNHASSRRTGSKVNPLKWYSKTTADEICVVWLWSSSVVGGAVAKNKERREATN